MQKFLYLPIDNSFVGVDYIKRVFVRCGLLIGENKPVYICIELHGDEDEYFYEKYEKEELAYIVMENIFKGIRTR